MQWPHYKVLKKEPNFSGIFQLLQNHRFPKLMEQPVLTTCTLVSGYLIKVRNKSFITLKGRFLTSKHKY